MVERILVLDVGTSSLKAVLFDRSGEVVAAAEAEYGPPPSAHRQDLDEWLLAARTAVAGLGGHIVDAIALTGTMENLIAVDGAGNAVINPILYSDPCGEPILNRLRPALDRAGATEILGNASEPLMTALKAAWLADAEPAAFASARWLLAGAKDVLALRLTGHAITDPVTATTTGLMNLRQRAWSPGLIAAFDLPAWKLPEILPAGAIVGETTPERAAGLGIAIQHPIPVVNGCGDGGATTLGSFCSEAGDISLYLGTSGWVARVVAEGALTPKPEVYRLAHPSAGLLIEITPILSAGAAGNWLRGVLDLGIAERDRSLAAADRDPGDLVFLPYLSGERFPFFDTDVRAAFLGLGAETSRDALYFAVLEGVAFAIRANLARLDPDGTGQVRLAGGGAQSAVWPQMIADILGRPLSLPADPANATAMGAFLIAAETFGLPGPSDRLTRTIAPRPERATRAARLAKAFTAGTAAMRANASK